MNDPVSTILLSNDDGVRAPGLTALASVLATRAALQVIAPTYDRSGVSNCLTLDRPLQVEELSNHYIGVDGTPTDCIHLGTSGIFGPVPDRVISGINYGANMGDDVLYSGTVAAAMEGRFLTKPAIAISLATTKGREVSVDFDTPAALFMDLLAWIETLQLPEAAVLNINIPDLPAADIRGVKFTTLGRRLKSENPVRTENPRGKTVYWIGRAGGPVEDSPGTDFHEVASGYISITPIHADMTHERALAELSALDTSHVAASISRLKHRR
jgi:5'-nucleotidase